MHNNMALRIHSYSLDPTYAARVEYLRDGAWQSLTSRLLTQTTEGSNYPIRISKKYRQMYTCSLTLDNSDGLLSPDNETSIYNLNASGSYDPLLDEARKMRVSQGVFLYEDLASGSTLTSEVAPTTGLLSSLISGVYASDADKNDAAFIAWSTVASDDTMWFKLDLGSNKTIQHICMSFLSQTNASPQIALPDSVKFEYSTDDSTYYSCGADFDMGKYADSLIGARCPAYITDINKTARYIRITVTNIAEENEIYIDGIGVWGDSLSVPSTIYTFTGYLGDDISENAIDGTITINFQDVTKREADNRRTELTLEYTNQRPEQIIYDLLTNTKYWPSTAIGGINMLTNGNFSAGSGLNATGWTRAAPVGKTAPYWGYPIGDGCMTWHVPYDSESDTQNAYIEQADVPVVAGSSYAVSGSYVVNYSDGAYAQFHVEIQPDGGAGMIRLPAAGSYTGDVVYPFSGSFNFNGSFTAPEGSTKVTVKVIRDDASTFRFLHLKDIFMSLATAITPESYSAPVDASEIGWTSTDNLSGFIVPQWQGQQGTILDYINELAQLIGWVYDADGDGVRQFWQPPESMTTASEFLSFFGTRMKRASRQRTGGNIRNMIKVVGFESGNQEVPREYTHPLSIARYGIRYGRVTEPLIRTAELSDRYGKALLRDFAWAGQAVVADVLGDLDLDRPKDICSFDETVRAHLDKNKLWSVESFESSMTVAGKGSYTSRITGNKFDSNVPAPLASIACTGGDTTIAVTWTTSSEPDIDGYYVYYSDAADGAYTQRTKVTSATDTITGLTNGQAYWIYVTAVNLSGVESEASALVRCLAGGGNSGDEASTWGITGLAAALTDNNPTVDLDLSWTPSLEFNPDAIFVTLKGPSTSNPPTNLTQQAKLIPANGTPCHWYAPYAKADLVGGTTYYWQIAIYEIIVDDRHHRFGTPLLSSVASAAWPS